MNTVFIVLLILFNLKHVLKNLVEGIPKIQRTGQYISDPLSS